MSIKGGEPYASWRVKHLAAETGLITKTSWIFDPTLFNGYEHRRTLGFKDGLSAGGNEEVPKDSRTYVFTMPTSAEDDTSQPRKKRRKII